MSMMTQISFFLQVLYVNQWGQKGKKNSREEEEYKKADQQNGKIKDTIFSFFLSLTEIAKKVPALPTRFFSSLFSLSSLSLRGRSVS